jgi:ABC-type Na+ transport system ATPase subunit NatA
LTAPPARATNREDMPNTNPSGSQAVVAMEKASRSFGAHEVLAGVSLSVRGGELVGIVGPNGGGKSTLLLLMAGLLGPTAGRVTVCGIDACALSLTAAGGVRLVTARSGLSTLLSGRENLHHFGGLFGLSPAEVDAKAEPLARTLEKNGWLARTGDGPCEALGLGKAPR